MIGGLDLSTHALDFVLIDHDPARCEHRRVELPSPWWDAARGMRKIIGRELLDEDEPSWTLSVDSWLSRNEVFLLGIERPYGPSRQAIASLHTILGAVLATVPPWITVLEVRPAEMRRELGLPGNASKERMHAAVMRYLLASENERIGWPPDALDAWAVAHATLRMCERAAA